MTEPNGKHDARCESEWVEGAGLYTECGCADRAELRAAESEIQSLMGKVARLEAARPVPVPVGHDNPADDLVEIAAKAIFEVKYPRHSPDASAAQQENQHERDLAVWLCRGAGAQTTRMVVPARVVLGELAQARMLVTCVARR